MTEKEKWQWQEPGTAWRGIGVYHVTLTVPTREPLFGTLVIPDNDPTHAWIERTPLGNAVVDELFVMCRHYPTIRILQFCLMPDHLHFIIHVTRVMDTSIRSVIRGYWQGVKKHDRAYSLYVAGELNSRKAGEFNSPAMDKEGWNARTMDNGHGNSQAMNEEGRKAGTGSEGEGGYPNPIFTERPFIRPLSRRGQLNTMMRYVRMNPQRLATKRLKPGFFRVQRDIVIGDQKYDGVGNVAILMEEGFATVHVRSTMVRAAEQGDDTPLRDYMNSCVLKARRGTVMVSPFISPQEKRVMEVLLQEKHPFVLLVDNGFRDYYKPADALFDACAEGRLLILSPWPYDEGKRQISRSECVALNGMAENICNSLKWL